MDIAPLLLYNSLDDKLTRLIDKYFKKDNNKLFAKYIYYGGDRMPEDSAFVVYGSESCWRIVKDDFCELFRIFNLNEERKHQFLKALDNLIEEHDLLFTDLKELRIVPPIFYGRKLNVLKREFSSNSFL
jgi:hypothetical protein